MSKIATEQQFQAWEAKIEAGEDAYQAAKDVGTTLSALGRGDRVRKEDGMDLYRERQAAKVAGQINEQLARPEPSPRLLEIKARAFHPNYAEKRQVEVSGTIQHEAKIVELGDVLDVIEGTGVDLGLPELPPAVDPSRGDVPSLEAVRAARAESAAGRLPAREES